MEGKAVKVYLTSASTSGLTVKKAAQTLTKVHHPWDMGQQYAKQGNEIIVSIARFLDGRTDAKRLDLGKVKSCRF